MHTSACLVQSCYRLKQTGVMILIPLNPRSRHQSRHQSSPSQTVTMACMQGKLSQLTERHPSREDNGASDGDASSTTVDFAG